MSAPMRLFVWGAGGHAKVVADAARRSGVWTVAGFIDDVRPERAGEEFFGSRVLGGREALAPLTVHESVAGIVAIGDCEARLRLSEWLRTEGFPVATVIHPAAVVAEGSRLGVGTFVAAGAVVAPDVEMGEAVILNTAASVDHDCVIGAGTHIGPGARLAGVVQVGRRSLVGTGAVITPGVRIGAECVLGAGALVVSDIPDGVVAYGNPARVVRSKDRID